MPYFHETQGGKPIMYGKLPEALDAVKRCAKALERIADSLEKRVVQEIVPVAAADRMISEGYRWVDKFEDRGELFAVFEKEVSRRD